MQFPDISSLPPWMQVAVILAFGLSLAVIFFVTRFGFVQGMKLTPEAAVSKAPVAAVVVDSTALNRASAALEEHNDLMRVNTEVVRDLADYVRRMAVEMDRIREELRLQRELAKYHKQ